MLTCGSWLYTVRGICHSDCHGCAVMHGHALVLVVWTAAQGNGGYSTCMLARAFKAAVQCVYWRYMLAC
jgi:hypothetical protein